MQEIPHVKRLNLQAENLRSQTALFKSFPTSFVIVNARNLISVLE